MTTTADSKKWIVLLVARHCDVFDIQRQEEGSHPHSASTSSASVLLTI